MKQEIKEEVLERLELDIKFGFENKSNLYESIREMFYDEEVLDENWLEQMISEKYNQHQNESRAWVKPTDFDKIEKTFQELITEKIVCLHKAGYTKQDSVADCMEAIEQLQKLGYEPLGYCYYHEQDLARAIDAEDRSLFLGFDSADENEDKALAIAKKIVNAFTKNGFQISWPGTVAHKIKIENITWQKTPDNQIWGPARAVEQMMQSKSSPKPFWKFW